MSIFHTQGKQWVRALESFTLLLYVLLAALAIYFLDLDSHTVKATVWKKYFPWFNLIIVIPSIFLLYRESGLRKFERVSIWLCCIFSLYISIVYAQELIAN